MKIIYSLFLCGVFSISVYGQDTEGSLQVTLRNDTAVIQQFFETELMSGKGYQVLKYLCKDIGGRLSGSEEAARAVVYMEKVMESYNFDTVYLQPVMVPHWVRGEKETAGFASGTDFIPVSICALGGSIGTGGSPITAKIIEVQSVKELKALPNSDVKGKIVFLNGKMNPTYIRTFKAYSETGAQRWTGPWVAAEKGAVGVIVRSLTTIIDTNAHTGSMGHRDDVKGIPSAAISTYHANQLHKTLSINDKTKFSFKMSCETLPDTLSYNVIGEFGVLTNQKRLLLLADI